MQFFHNATDGGKDATLITNHVPETEKIGGGRRNTARWLGRKRRVASRTSYCGKSSVLRLVGNYGHGNLGR